jgi:hypothetical protein
VVLANRSKKPGGQCKFEHTCAETAPTVWYCMLAKEHRGSYRNRAHKYDETHPGPVLPHHFEPARSDKRQSGQPDGE